jgi:hypothetical protein
LVKAVADDQSAAVLAPILLEGLQVIGRVRPLSSSIGLKH